MPSYRPAGEDGPNAMMAQAADERREEGDPIRRGWPGPMSAWTARQREVFERAKAEYEEMGFPSSRAWAYAYGEVTTMPEGMSRPRRRR